MEKKDIEIPFGAFDSELGGFEYTIPEGYKAEIKDGKVVVRKTESEDEKIRKVLLNDFKNNCSEYYCEGVNRDMIIAWLEKQAEQKPTDKKKLKFKKGDRVIGIVSGMQYYITEVSNDSYYTESGVPILFYSQDNFELYKQDCIWGEEDQMIASRIASVLEEAASEHAFMSTKRLIGDKEVIEIESWLKSLEDRYTWKPSDEQIDALEDAIADAVSSIQKNMLNSLYSDLKEL